MTMTSDERREVAARLGWTMAEHEGIWSEYRPTYWDGWSAVKRMGDLVRCRDCMNVDVEDYGPWGRVWHCEGFGEVEPDGYCAWGERR